MASKKISVMPELLSLTDDDFLTVVDVSQLPGTPDQANAKIKRTNLGLAATSALTAHTSNTSNPHSVTAAQVGADPSGSAAAVQSNLDAHTSNTSNPHSVTAAQVGADVIGIHSFVSVPASPTASGSPGQWAWDGTYVYICVAANTWVRFAPQRTWT